MAGLIVRRQGANRADFKGCNGKKKRQSLLLAAASREKEKDMARINPGDQSRLYVDQGGGLRRRNGAEQTEYRSFGRGAEAVQRDKRPAGVSQTGGVVPTCGSRKFSFPDLAAIAARGGVVGQLESGAYPIDDNFADASRNSPIPHPANLSPVIATSWPGSGNGIHGYVYDAVRAAENRIRFFTSPACRRSRSCFDSRAEQPGREHRTGKRDGVRLEDTTYIVCHLGGGVTSI